MPGLLRGVARTAVVAGTATAVSNRVSRRQAGRWAQQDYAQQTAYQQQAPAAPAPEAQAQRAPSDGSPDDMADRIAQLKELSELKAQGVLTDEEFEAQKRRVLG
ncbi:SHOCT domain-containing protein [Streptomyces actuosus]|uniref:SHOCT domain-containing protein n=1 Tax=Streptomyces actuosus TaxID=1885 RepID=A0ABS2VN35_STRAS|nr:SHOCT domain-containing protein [Streptomyces actuosus]MBN0044529.1 SHOCT domain-containing protein [Streptomyces actuosus]